MYGGFGRLHLFQASNFEEIKQKILDSATANLGISIKILSVPITLEDFQCQRLGKYRLVLQVFFHVFFLNSVLQ